MQSLIWVPFQRQHECNLVFELLQGHCYLALFEWGISWRCDRSRVGAGLWPGGQTHEIPGAAPSLARAGRPAYCCPCRSLSRQVPLPGYPMEGQTLWHSRVRIKQMGFRGAAQQGVRSGCCAPCSPQNRSVLLSDGSRFAARLLRL